MIMNLKPICLTVFTVVFLSLVMLMNGLSVMIQGSDYEAENVLSEYDATDMSQYYVMGEYYPPDDVDTINIDWQGGRVEIIAYDGDYYFMEEAATRQLQEPERLSYTLNGNEFSVYFSDSEENAVKDAYKKLEIRIPKDVAALLKKVNINTNGEVVLKNIKADSVTVNGTDGNVFCDNTYSKNMYVYTKSGNVDLILSEKTGYKLHFDTQSGNADTYFEMDGGSYSCGDELYSFNVKTGKGNLSASSSNE